MTSQMGVIPTKAINSKGLSDSSNSLFISASQDKGSMSSATSSPCSDIKRHDLEANMAHALVPDDPNARPKEFKNIFEEVFFIFTVMMANASTTFLQGAVVINTANIGKDLRMTPAQITWIAAGIGYVSHI
jgi:hypothetical protein